MVQVETILKGALFEQNLLQNPHMHNCSTKRLVLIHATPLTNKMPKVKLSIVLFQVRLQEWTSNCTISLGTIKADVQL
jgi:hypothetical protein